MPALAAGFGRDILDTLHERVGDLDQLRNNPALGQSRLANGLWGRVIGGHGDYAGRRNGILDGRPSYDTDLLAFQVGADVYRNQRDNGRRDHVGVYGAYGKINGDVDHSVLGNSFHAGSIDTKGWSLGVTWTHYTPDAAYLDLVAQATWYDFRMKSARFEASTTDGFGLALSAEGGYPFDLDAHWRVEPQAQLIYQMLDIDRFSDDAADISFASLNSLVGRLGLRLARYGDKQGWLRANVWHEFKGKPVTRYSSADGLVPFQIHPPATWAEFGLGYSLRVDELVTLYSSGAYETTFSDRFESYDIKLGVRFNW